MPPSSDSLSVTLLGNDPGDAQWSMLYYGQALQQSLSALLGSPSQVRLLHPDTQHAVEKWRRFRIGRAAAMYGSRYIRYPRLLRKGFPGITHILDHGNSLLIRHLDPSRTAITCHDLIPLILRNKSDSPFPFFSEKSYRHAISGLSQARAILAVSEQTRQDLIERLGLSADRIHVVPLGIDPRLVPVPNSEAKERLRKSLHLPDGTLLFHVGQNAFYKNLEGLLESLQILIQRKEPVWLIRAGAFLSAKQRRLAKHLGVLEKIMDWGPLSQEKLRQLYQTTDLLVHPSWYEGLGLPSLEAMACGLPVIVSNRGALPETVGDAALTIDPDDPTQLAHAVQRLLQDSALRQELRTRGLSRSSQFRWEITAQKTLRVYQTLLR